MIVKDLYPLFDALAGTMRATDDIKRALLNAARLPIWRLIIASQDGQFWFGGKSYWGDTGAENYFPVLEPGTLEYRLPNNFHQLLAVRAESQDMGDVRFEPTQLDDATESLASHGGNMLGDRAFRYTIYGPFFQLVEEPPQVIEARLWYVKTPDEWPLPASSIDEFPRGTHDLLVEWAVQRHAIAVGDRRWAQFEQEWMNRVRLWIASSRRDRTGPIIAGGYLEGY